MTATYSQNEILHGVRQDISECLGQDFDDVTPGATFFNDLGGESIDVIDLSFRCEKRFGVRIAIQSLMANLQLDPTGHLSEASLGDLEAKAPEIDWSARIAAMSGNDPRDLLTVDLIAELVRREVGNHTKDSGHR